MAEFRPVHPAEMIMGRLGFGCDLLEELTSVATERGILLGRIEAFGAVRKARIGFYNQTIRAYQFESLDRPLEITKLIGNISLKDEKPFVHAHITLSDESGKAYGGHLAPGTVVFACEFILQAFDGPSFNRRFEEETGLALWSIP
ncbi:MAG: DNA-binding protein [Deltaproteobacteria bacterium]|nr:DNA-binding protein [Deltaproteobacteria bacterium]